MTAFLCSWDGPKGIPGRVLERGPLSCPPSTLSVGLPPSSSLSSLVLDAECRALRTLHTCPLSHGPGV